MERNNRYQMNKKDILLLEAGDKIYSIDPFTYKMEEMEVLQKPSIEGDEIIIGIKILSHGFKTELRFNKNYEINVWTSKLISDWRAV